MDIKQTQPDVAEKVLERVVDTQSEDVFGVRILGWAKLCLGKADEAIQYLLQAIRLDPKHGETYLHIAMAYRDIGNYHSATMYMFRALEQNQSPEYWCYMAKLFSEIKAFVAARHYYRKALERDPNYIPAHYGLAFVYALEQDWDNFLEEYEWIISTTPISELGAHIILHCPKPLMGLFSYLAELRENSGPPATEVTDEPLPAGGSVT